MVARHADRVHRRSSRSSTTGSCFSCNSEDIVQALDATNGDLLWEYRRKLPESIGGVTGTGYRYRNVSIYDDKIFLATNDASVVALDARSGALVWETQRANYKDQIAQTTGPIVVKGKLINGIAVQSAEPSAGRLLHHRARCATRRGTVADLRHRATGRTGRRYVGRTAARGAPPRVGVDGRQLRSGAEPRLLGDGRHGALAREVCAAREPAICSTRTPRWQSIPTPARWSGTFSTCRATTGTSITCSSE